MSKTKGLYKKFNVTRADGQKLPATAKFLPLRLDDHGDPRETAAARCAALAYAHSMGHGQLAADLVSEFGLTTAIRPHGSRVLIEADAPTDTAGILHIPDEHRKKSRFGTVVALGKGARNKDGTVRPFDVRVGDRVVFSEYGGTPFEIGGRSFQMLDDDQIFAVVENKA